MKNIGPVSRKWLAEVGIYTVEELRTAGSIPTYEYSRKCTRKESA
ncbi:MAG TPA: TfoX/Sxy family DNA transformation protein [candidate division Zixibacteria bacterium]|nr:TfoX/Sxy family DNA transformation protein [candidate division Zixibacteria bacterium]